MTLSAEISNLEARLIAEFAAVHAAQARIEAKLTELRPPKQQSQEAESDFVLSRSQAEIGPSKQQEHDEEGCEMLSQGSVNGESRDRKFQRNISVGTAFSSEKVRFSPRSARPTEDTSGRFVASTLPMGWPSTLRRRVAANWYDARRQGSANSVTVASMTAGRTGSPDRQFPGFTTTDWVSRSTEFGRPFCVIDPNSTFYLVYSCFSMLVLCYDLISLPVMLAFDLEYTGVLYAMWWFSPIFWTLDIVINFFTGIYKKGEFQTELAVIRRSYCRSWFLPDAAVVMCDWSGILLEVTSKAQGTRSLKLLRFTKLGRLLRILVIVRLFRLAKILEDWAVRYVSEGGNLALKLCYISTGIMFAAHLIACMWYLMGKAAPTDTGIRWYDTNGIIVRGNFVPLAETGLLYEYMSCLSWAVAQISMGGLDQMPTNSAERLFYIGCMMCGFLFGSTLVSTLAAATMDYQMMKKDRTLKMRALRQYLRENLVEAHVSISVQKQAELRLSERVALDEKDVAALQLLSNSLRSHLRFEIQRPHLTKHAMFRLWARMDPKFMHRVCMKAVSVIYLQKRDELFAPGSSPSAAHTIMRGDICYTQYPDSSPVQDEEISNISSGAWLCEAALWVVWVHVGKAEALTQCSLLEVGVEALSNCLMPTGAIRDITLDYACQFHKRVISACPPHSPWPTDLVVPFTDYCDLVVAMSPSCQLLIGNEALSYYADKSIRGGKALEKLADEVRSSKSIVVVLGSGAVIRVVSLVVLRIQDESQNVLVQVGKFDGTDIRGMCHLPGLKQERDELVSDTVDRLFNTIFPSMPEKLEFLGSERESTENLSKQFGIHTRYIRTICNARLRPGEDFGGQHVRSRMSSGTYQDIVATSDSMNSGLMDVLLAIDVFSVPSGRPGGMNLYAWLPPNLFTILSSPSKDSMLQAWVARIDLPSLGGDMSASSSQKWGADPGHFTM